MHQSSSVTFASSHSSAKTCCSSLRARKTYLDAISSAMGVAALDGVLELLFVLKVEPQKTRHVAQTHAVQKGLKKSERTKRPLDTKTFSACLSFQVK